jgi:hypothetical protein
VVREALTIAAEQRRVRAEFVFMMGGEVPEDIVGGADAADDHDGLGDGHWDGDGHQHNTQGEDDILSGRLANRGRIEVVRAIRAMSQASTLLTRTELTTALAQERLALESLQRAFARSRYILRALTERERLDLARRGTGVLAELGRPARPSPDPQVDPRTVALRRALAMVASVGGDRAAAAAAAQEVLRVDPASPVLQDVARLLADASQGGGGAADAVRRATVLLAAEAGAGLATAPVRTSHGGAMLGGALSDALRRGRP